MKRTPLAWTWILTLAAFAAPAAHADWRDKVDPWVFDQLTRESSAEAEFLIVLAEQADLSAAKRLRTKLEKGTFVYETLTATAARTQGDLLSELAAAGLEHRSFWVANMVWAKGDEGAVASLAARDDVARIAANPRVRFEAAVRRGRTRGGGSGARRSPDTVEWNISQVNADDVWALGFNGQGAVDRRAGHRLRLGPPGAHRPVPRLERRHRRPQLQLARRDPRPAAAAVAPTRRCRATTTATAPTPWAPWSGDDGGANQIGMAPGAKWIGCRNMNSGDGTPATYTECFQWFIAPTDLANANPNPALAPDVINNSWGCPAERGLQPARLAAMRLVVENVRAAGIFIAVSAGNDGSGCSTVDTPAAIYDASFTVGSTTEHRRDRRASRAAAR